MQFWGNKFTFCELSFSGQRVKVSHESNQPGVFLFEIFKKLNVYT